MNILSVSAAFTTDNVTETRDFYVRHFGARVTFDCGWYVNLEFGDPCATLQFMSPRQPEHRLSSGEGLIYNFAVDNVDREHERLKLEGLEVVVPLEDHPWGDRGFAVLDPNGISLYLYSEREPDGEFRQYYR
ncbi:glyoxalase [Prosthecochloris sp. GSB1]|uniref:VOC family protein n=1 Tax=Prosthecochloris sp. GSB1 TaxID=281093 RepID=UPI000B8CEB9C|nr:VOC family protein [Prosthecochloris sp. GSB1]ASQ90684.1 glyoxalase [Prosthecochloris sp. GSB1]